MYYLAFTPLWILVILTDIFSIMDNEADLYTEKTSIPFLFGAFLVALHIVRKELTSEKVCSGRVYDVIRFSDVCI